MKKTISIIGVQPLYKSLLNRLISTMSELSLERIYDTAADAIQLLQHPTDIVLIDVADLENNSSAFELIRKLHAATEMQCIVCSMNTSDRMIRSVFEAGASGFIKLDSPYVEISKLFRVIVSGGVPVSDFVTRRLISLMVDKDIQTISNPIFNNRNKEIVKNTCIMIDAYLNQPHTPLRLKMSEFLSSNLHISYGYLSVVFHEAKGFSLRDYVIRRKIEKVKMMMRDDKITLTQIANKLDYSSVAHLSSQFLRVVGINPSTYRSRMLVFEDTRKTPVQSGF
jgi:AraC-like DNA-binding protein